MNKNINSQNQDLENHNETNSFSDMTDSFKKKGTLVYKIFSIVNLSAILIFATLLFGVFYGLAYFGQMYARVALVMMILVGASCAFLILEIALRKLDKKVAMMNFGNAITPLSFSLFGLAYVITFNVEEFMSFQIIAFIFVTIIGFLSGIGFILTGVFSSKNFIKRKKTLQISFVLWTFLAIVSFVITATVAGTRTGGNEGLFSVAFAMITLMTVIFISGIISIVSLREQ